MTKFSIITVAYNNLNGVEKTFNSLSELSTETLRFIEWIVVDGNSSDGTKEYLKNLNPDFKFRFVSEKDEGIYDAMNKGIAMSCGDYTLFLNSGDVFSNQANYIVSGLLVESFSNDTIYLCDAILDFDNGVKKIRKAKYGVYIYHSLPASHQAIIYPTVSLKSNMYDTSYKVSSDYALTARLFKNGHVFKRLDGVLSEFSMGGVSTTNNSALCADAYRVQVDILNLPSLLAKLSFKLRSLTTGKAKKMYGKF